MLVPETQLAPTNTPPPEPVAVNAVGHKRYVKFRKLRDQSIGVRFIEASIVLNWSDPQRNIEERPGSEKFDNPFDRLTPLGCCYVHPDRTQQDQIELNSQGSHLTQGGQAVVEPLYPAAPMKSARTRQQQ
jgi:hypothetical protein